MGEESHEEDVAAASYSKWLDSQTTHQSQWLQATLSDLDETILKMVNLMEDGGDTFAKRAQMYYNSRPQFIKMVQDLRKSYRFLAAKYDQLRYESVSSSCKNTQIKKTRSLENSKLEAPIFVSKYEMLNRKQENDVENWVDVCKTEQEDNNWNDISLQIADLIDENKEQQAELIRRNEEKMNEIKAVYKKVDKLMEENKNLKNKLAECKSGMNQNQSHLSKFKKIVFGKLAN